MQSYVVEESGGEGDTIERKDEIHSEASHEECVGLVVDTEDSFNEKDGYIPEEEEGEISINSEINIKSKPIPIPISPQNSSNGGIGGSNHCNEIITQEASSLPNQNLFGNQNINKMATQTAFAAMMSVWEPVRAFVSRLQNLNATPVKFSFPKISIPSWVWGGGGGDSKTKEKKSISDMEIDMGSDDDDLFSIGNMPTSRNFQSGSSSSTSSSSQNRQRYVSADLFMGKYSEKDIWKIINELRPYIFGKTIRQLLEARGYKDIDLEMDTSDPFVHKLNLYYVGNLKRKDDLTSENATNNSTFSIVESQQSQQSQQSGSSSATSSSSATQNESSGWFGSFFNSGNNTKKKEENDDNKKSNNNNDNSESESSGGGASSIWPFSLLGARTPEKKKKDTEEKKVDEKKNDKEIEEKKSEIKEIDKINSDNERVSEDDGLVRSPSPTILNIRSPPVSRNDLFQAIPNMENTSSQDNNNDIKQPPTTDKLFEMDDNEDDVHSYDSESKSEDKSDTSKTLLTSDNKTDTPKSLLTNELENAIYESDNISTASTITTTSTTINNDSIVNDDDDDDNDDEEEEETEQRRFSPNKLLAQLFVRRETSFSVMETKSFTCKESGVPKFYAKAFNDGLLVLRNFFKTEKLQMVVIEWLRMQDPLKSFGDRTPLPGQLHPGLGLGNDASKILCMLARNKGRDGILNLPEHFYNAYLYAQGFSLYHFLNPAFEGYFKSICKAIEPDIKERGISAVAWAVFRGMLHCRMPDGDSDISVPVTPSRIKWVSQEQVCPLSGRMTKYFKSSEYANAVKKAYHPEAFSIMWEQLEDDSFISTSCPN